MEQRVLVRRSGGALLLALLIAVALLLVAAVAAGASPRRCDGDSDRHHHNHSAALKNAARMRALKTPFTIAAIPDTQVYSEEGDPGFQKQVDWLLANAEARNIVFVTHLGDVVDNGTDVEQWTNAMAALDPLLKQSRLPFSIVRGNHDDPAFYLQNLPVSLMKSKPWFVGASRSGLATAQTFTVQKAEFLHIGFQKDPTDAELRWANRLVRRPALEGMPVIVSTHDYIDGSGKSVTGRNMWEKFVRDNPMVFMVLNGHTHTEYALVNHNAKNRPVYQMLSDYQDRANCGNGLMRLITVDPRAGKIQVKTFSPWYEDAAAEYYETDYDSEFEYSLNLRERLAWNTHVDFGPEPPAPPLPPLNAIPASVTYSHVFQNRRELVGATTPYAGTVDVQINENNAGLNYGGEATLTTDMDDNGSRVNAMLRFDGLVGAGAGQIKPGSKILSATLVFTATSSTKGKVVMHRMLKPWGETSTWNDFTPQPSGVAAPDLPQHRHGHLPVADARQHHGGRRRRGRRRRGHGGEGRHLHDAEADPHAVHPDAGRLRDHVPGAGQGPRHRRRAPVQASGGAAHRRPDQGRAGVGRRPDQLRLGLRAHRQRRLGLRDRRGQAAAGALRHRRGRPAGRPLTDPPAPGPRTSDPSAGRSVKRPGRVRPRRRRRRTRSCARRW